MSKLIIYRIGVGDIFSNEAVRVIENASEINKLVLGTLEEVPLTDELFLVTSFELNYMHAFANRVLLKDGEYSRVIFGEAIVVRKNADGVYVNIQDADFDVIESSLRPVVMYSHARVSYFKEDMKEIATYEFEKS